MAKLFEHQAKSLLQQAGIAIPRGSVAGSAAEAEAIAAGLEGPVVIKAQTWGTGRLAQGGIRFAANPEEARLAAADILGMELHGLQVSQVLVEERLPIAAEFFLGLTIDDAERAPVAVFSSVGGSGIEEIAGRHPDKVRRLTIDVLEGLPPHQARNLLVALGIRGRLQHQLTEFLVKFYQFCRRSEVRSAEVNPLIFTEGGKLVAADCHLVVDDYAVFRHPEMGIEVAREFDRPPTPLEKVAYQVEAADHRGTFYFYEMAKRPGEGYVGFHGAGGGGAMMSMDALLSEGLQVANYCDTSGNPSAAKVYRAAKIILSQPQIIAYFASGSGVASQEQYHSARGLVKAFREIRPAIPAVIRLGGNSEDLAMDILHRFTADLPGHLEAYGRDTSARQCARRLRQLLAQWQPASPQIVAKADPDFSATYKFKTLTGAVLVDQSRCHRCGGKPCIEACDHGILRLQNGSPVLALEEEAVAKGRCTECLACELACQFNGRRALVMDLPIAGLEEILSTSPDR